MTQNRGKKRPMMNMIQWPLRIEAMPRVTSKITYKTPSAIQMVEDAARRSMG
jgi:hypothetical protein